MSKCVRIRNETNFEFLCVLCDLLFQISFFEQKVTKDTKNSKTLRSCVFH